MNIWEITFNKPDGPIIGAWEKMFKPIKADNKGSIFGLDKKTCDAARVFYGPNHPLVKSHCKPQTKFKIIWT